MKALEKELQRIEKKELRLLRQAQKQSGFEWKNKLEEKIPARVMDGLQKAFSKAFSIVFEKGVVVIEKTFDKDSLEKEFQISDYAMDVKGGRKEIARIKKAALGSHAVSTAVTAVEGVGLGLLGIGLPDLVLWVGVMLRGVYETAIHYGFDYDSLQEKMYILKLMEASMQKGENWESCNRQVESYIRQMEHAVVRQDELSEQIEMTANAFATEMLVAKFIQGLPLMGVIGGAANPVYYQKVMKYVQLKYRKRYLLSKMKKI